jgi:hypothetical protein
VTRGRNRKLSCVTTENFFATYEKKIPLFFRVLTDKKTELSYTDFHLVKKLVLPAHGNVDILLFRAAHVFAVERGGGGHIFFSLISDTNQDLSLP